MWTYIRYFFSCLWLFSTDTKDTKDIDIGDDWDISIGNAYIRGIYTEGAYIRNTCTKSTYMGSNCIRVRNLIFLLAKSKFGIFISFCWSLKIILYRVLYCCFTYLIYSIVYSLFQLASIAFSTSFTKAQVVIDPKCI